MGRLFPVLTSNKFYQPLDKEDDIDEAKKRNAKRVQITESKSNEKRTPHTNDQSRRKMVNMMRKDEELLMDDDTCKDVVLDGEAAAYGWTIPKVEILQPFFKERHIFFIGSSIFHLSLELLTKFWKTRLKVA